LESADSPIGRRHKVGREDLSIKDSCNEFKMDHMTTLTLSRKFQVVIPKHIREAMQLTAGMPMQVVRYGDRIEIIPVRPMKAIRGLLKGMDTVFERDDDR